MKKFYNTFPKVVEITLSYLGDKSLPCCIRDPIVNHIEFTNEKSFTNTSDSVLQGWGLSHSYGLNLKKKIIINLWNLSTRFRDCSNFNHGSFFHFKKVWITYFTTFNLRGFSKTLLTRQGRYVSKWFFKCQCSFNKPI